MISATTPYISSSSVTLLGHYQRLKSLDPYVLSPFHKTRRFVPAQAHRRTCIRIYRSVSSAPVMTETVERLVSSVSFGRIVCSTLFICARDLHRNLLDEGRVPTVSSYSEDHINNAVSACTRMLCNCKVEYAHLMAYVITYKRNSIAESVRHFKHLSTSQKSE